MRPWRDIPSTGRWEKWIGRARAHELAEILRAIAAYHSIRKDDLNNFGGRATALRRIAALGQAYYGRLQRQGTSLGPNYWQKPRAEMKSGGTFATDDLRPDQYIRSLIKRAIAKAGYLDMIVGYYTADARQLDPNALINKLKGRQDVGAGTVGMMPGVALEASDPVHRGWEVEYFAGDATHQEKIIGLSSAGVWLQQWFAQTQAGYSQPFFVYLENTDHCLDPETAKQAGSVKYVDDGDRQRVVYTLDVQGATLRMGRLDNGTFVYKPFDTSWITSGHTAKGKPSMNRPGLLAYVWTDRNEFFAGLHNPLQGEYKSFHHSSFTGGGMVQCAGMIGGTNGMVTYIDNDSGHYRPPLDALKRMVSHLQSQNVLAPTANVGDAAAMAKHQDNAIYPATTLLRSPAAAAARP